MPRGRAQGFRKRELLRSPANVPRKKKVITTVPSPYEDDIYLPTLPPVVYLAFLNPTILTKAYYRNHGSSF